MAKTPDFINSVCRQWLFSPKGEIEGALLTVKGALLQLSVTRAIGAMLALVTRPGKRLRVLALLDHSPKTADGAHPVYHFTSFADATGQPIDPPGANPAHARINGVVAAVHYARHGQPNGVMLASGEFIHLRPQGMVRAGLGVGAKVAAVGERRLTVLGTPMLEAHQVNRITLV